MPSRLTWAVAPRVTGALLVAGLVGWGGHGPAYGGQEPYQLLFSGVPRVLSASDMRTIAQQLGFKVDASTRQLVSLEACGAIAHEVQVQDLNNDGQVEVVVIAGNACTSGHAGADVTVFAKSPGTAFRAVLQAPGLSAVPRAARSEGFADLMVGGPGFCQPVWRWSRTQYRAFCALEQQPGACVGDSRLPACGPDEPPVR